MSVRARTPTVRTQQSVRRAYETLQPRSEMKETPEAFLLHIYLPGFTKERIKITFVGSSRMVKISGERPIQGNKWSRFDQSYPVPENCEAESLRGKFEVGTLVLTMPKKLVSQVEPQVSTTQERGPGPSAQETIPQQYTTATKLEEPLIGDKKSASSLPSPAKGPSDLKAQKPADEKGLKALIPPEPVRGQEQTVKRPAVTGKPRDVQEGFESKPNLTMRTEFQTGEKPPKLEKEVEPKATLTAVAGDPAEEKREKEIIGQKTRLAAVKKQLEEKTEGTRAEVHAEKERISKKEVKEEYGMPSEPKKPANNAEKGIFKEKEIRTRKVSPKVGETSAPKVSEKDKESNSGTVTEDMIDVLGNGIRELAASASLVVTRIAEGKWNEEEKHLVVNMGAAVLVIAALGAYVSYRFASS